MSILTYSLRELRECAKGIDPLQYDEMQSKAFLQEAARILDEAFYGRTAAAKIQAAMEQICKEVQDNPDINLNKSAGGAALNKAVVDTFGVNRCTVYWTNTGLMRNVASTIPGTTVTFLINTDDAYTYGTHKKGFYDDKHKMDIVATMETHLISEAGLTPEEMTAIFIHEIGHNFDFSIYRITGIWYRYFSTLYTIFMKVLSGDIGSAAGYGVASSLMMLLQNSHGGKQAYYKIMNLDNELLNLLPPIGSLARSIGKPVSAVQKLLQTVNMFKSVASIPYIILLSPLTQIQNIITRKSETYADSFAASYGYGAELGTALEKVNMSTISDNAPLSDSILAPLYDLYYMYLEFLNFIANGHGNTQQRMIRLMDKFDQDLKAADLTPADRAAILKEKERVEKFYNEFISNDAQHNGIFTSIFRDIVNAWYNGKPYGIVPLMRDQTYAN